MANISHRNRHSHTQVRTRRMRTVDLHRRRGRHWRTGTYLRTGSHFRCRPWEEAEEAEILLEEEVVETRTPFASALPLLFLEMFPQPAALPAFDDVLELTAQAREVMALVATLPLILHIIVLAQSPALQRRKNMMSSGHTSEATRKLCQPATWRCSKRECPAFSLESSPKPSSAVSLQFHMTSNRFWGVSSSI